MQDNILFSVYKFKRDVFAIDKDIHINIINIAYSI